MPVQPTVHPAQRASGNCSALSEARLLSAVATLRNALAPDVALNLPAVLDRSALLDCLSVLLTNTHPATTTPAPVTLTVLKPSRFTAGGYCRECIRPGCTDVGCVYSWNHRRWGICPVCSGSGYEDIEYGPDNACVTCTDGLVEAMCQDPSNRNCRCVLCVSVDTESTSANSEPVTV